MVSQPIFTLYSRQYCHLCDEMLAELLALRRDLEVGQGGEAAFVLEVQDVDADLALLARYDELVPVLVAEGRVLCHYRLDWGALRAYLPTLSSGFPLESQT